MELVSVADCHEVNYSNDWLVDHSTRRLGHLLAFQPPYHHLVSHKLHCINCCYRHNKLDPVTYSKLLLCHHTTLKATLFAKMEI